MRKFVMTAIMLTLIVFLGSTANAQQSATASNALAIINWETVTHDFGEIEQGKPVSYDFEFKNSGSVPLVISNVKASCGCTATNYPKSQIQPGESAIITATYNAKSAGSFSKTLTVYTNTEESVHVLKIKGKVQ